MSKLMHLAAAALFAAVAAASLFGLAGAVPDQAVGAETCEAALCFVAFF